MSTNLFASPFDQVLSFSVVLNISSTLIFGLEDIITLVPIRNVVGFLAFKPFFFVFNPYYSVEVFLNEMFE